MLDAKQIAQWCEAHLFGGRIVQGIKIPLSPTQQAILRLAVDVIQKWEEDKNAK